MERSPLLAGLQQFRFVSHLYLSGGLLPDLPGAHACWYYCRCAIQMWKAVNDGAQYEGELDHINMQNNLARGVAIIYKLDSPDDFLKFMDIVKLEAIRCSYEWDMRIERPGTSPFIKN